MSSCSSHEIMVGCIEEGTNKNNRTAVHDIETCRIETETETGYLSCSRDWSRYPAY